jgi:hypothetical protein
LKFTFNPVHLDWMTGGITGASIPPVFLSAGKGERQSLISSTAERVVEEIAIRLMIF